MGWNIVGLGGSGAGFQLFKKTTDGESAIFADATARDVYFAANPADLTLLDNDQFLIIKLLNDGFGDVAYQQRQLGTWVDVTSLIQGETGPPGATGNSYFFASIAARDAFFLIVGNEALLESGLPVCVNVGNETFSTFIWNGITSPPTYDPDDWVTSSIQVNSGTVFLGQGGASLSSGNEVIGFNTAGEIKRYLIGVQYANGGSITPAYWELSPLVPDILSPLFTQTLSDPQSIQYQFTSDEMLTEFRLRPSIIGELRIQMWLGTDNTGAQLADSFFTVTAPDIGNQITYAIPNDSLITSGTDIYVTFSGIQLFGDLQTTGPFNGLTVPAITIGIQAAISVNFVANISGSLPIGQVSYGGSANFIESEPDFFWDSVGKNLGINEAAPDTTLHVDSQSADTEAIIKLENTSGFVEEYAPSGTPEGVITAGFGARSTDLTTGDLWIKQTASGNTGWIDLATSSGAGDVNGPASSIDTEIAVFNGVTGKIITGGTNVLAVPGTAADIFLNADAATDRPTITWNDQTDSLGASIHYEPDNTEFIITTVNTNGIVFNASNYISLNAPASFIALQSFLGNQLRATGNVGDGRAPLLLASTGLNSSQNEIFVGDRDPDGNVTGNDGDVYIRSDGVNSNIYQLHSALTANTPWVPIAQGSGDVVGPASSTDEELAVFDGTTGKLIKGGSQVTVTAGVSANLNISTTDNAVYPKINFLDDLAVSGGHIQYESDFGSIDIISFDKIYQECDAAFTITSLSSSVEISGAFGVLLSGSGAGDAQPAYIAETTGANGTNTAHFVGSRNPEGLVTGQGSAIYTSRIAGVSNMYQMEAVGSANSPWYPFVKNIDGAELPAGLIPFGAGNNKLNSDEFLTWDSVGKNLGVNQDGTTVTLHVNSRSVDTEPIARFENGNGSPATYFQFFRVSGDPNGSVSSTLSSLCFDQSNGRLFIKTGNVGLPTGWQQLGGSATLTWGDGLIGTSITTRFLSPGYDGGAAPTSPIQIKASRSGKLRDFRVFHNTPAGNGNDITYTMRVNSVATPINVTMASTASNGIDILNEVDISAGDSLDIEVVKLVAIGTSPSNVMVSIGIY